MTAHRMGSFLILFLLSCLPWQSVHADDWSSLRAAIYYQREAEVVQLLDSGVDINIRNEEGWSPLHIAAEQGMLRMVNYLLARGADANLRTKRDRTAYDVASGYPQVRAALKAKMAPEADPFAPYLPAAGAAVASPAQPQRPPVATRIQPVGPLPAVPAAAQASAASPKPAPAPAAVKDDGHCKQMWHKSLMLCDSSDRTCKMLAHNRYQGCLKKGTWY